MKAVILTAGFARRMQPLSNHLHKTLIKIDGREILYRIVDGLLENKIKDLVIITGYKENDIKQALSEEYPDLNIQYIHNEKYETTNNIYSMSLALDGMEIDDDILLIESDLVCENSIFKKIIETKYSNAALVDKYRSGMDGTVVSVKNNKINNIFLPHNQDENFDFSDKYKTLNIYKFSRVFCNTIFKDLLNYYSKTIDDNCYYELILGILIYLQKEEINAEIIKDEKWAEVDDPNDLKSAEFLFSKKRKIDILEETFGGYWAYDITDFCFIRNMYFPNSSMLSEIHNNSSGLLYNYGSKQGILNTKLSYFAKYKKENLILLNGASQIYPILKQKYSKKKVLMPFPTFGEYTRIFDNSISYSDAGVIDVAEISQKIPSVDIVVIVNPNNPTGSIVETSVIYEMAASDKNKLFIIDESFLEFSEEKSIIELLEHGPLENVLVIKSLSKVLGVPGIRLGYSYSCNREMNEFINSHIPIWNTNSFAEFYLELLLKNKNDLEESFKKTKKDRDDFCFLLNTISFVENVFPSSANFVLVKLKKGFDTIKMSKELLQNNAIYIKDVTSKFDDEFPYLRLAVRLPEENIKLIDAFKAFEES